MRARAQTLHACYYNISWYHTIQYCVACYHITWYYMGLQHCRTRYYITWCYTVDERQLWSCLAKQMMTGKPRVWTLLLFYSVRKKSSLHMYALLTSDRNKGPARPLWCFFTVRTVFVLSSIHLPRKQGRLYVEVLPIRLQLIEARWVSAISTECFSVSVGEWVVFTLSQCPCGAFSWVSSYKLWPLESIV